VESSVLTLQISGSELILVVLPKIILWRRIEGFAEQPFDAEIAQSLIV
jgi:hypothetical protein